MKRRLFGLVILVAVLAVVQVSAVAVDALDAEFDPAQGTIEVWIKPSWSYDEAASNHQMVFYWGPQGWVNELRFFVYNQQVLAARWMADGKVMSAETLIGDWVEGEWHYVVTTWDGAAATAKLYIDGELVAEVSDWEVPKGTADYSVGHTPEGGSVFIGKLEDMKISTAVKTAEEIKATYEADRGKYTSDQVGQGPTDQALETAAEKKSTAADLVWWDHFPLIIETTNITLASKFPTDAVMDGFAVDPTWGIFAQAQRTIGSYTDGSKRTEALGLKSIGYYETFGQAATYLAEVEKTDDGEWVRHPSGVTRILHNHWNWQNYSGKEIVWVGVHNYFDDEDFARPYTRVHERYGAPPMRYPDGTVATGYLDGENQNPLTSRIFDAGAAKTIFGDLVFEPFYNEAVNEVVMERGKAPYLRGPIDGTVQLSSTDYHRYSSFNISKDVACPSWIDYAYASALFAADNGQKGMWSDNYSAWDSFGYPPVNVAFGDWSEATFREFLKDNFTPSELAEMGVEDVESFSISKALIEIAENWAGREVNSTRDAIWKDARWLDEPLWLAYMIHKRQIGEKGLRNYYNAVKTAAAEAGQPDYLVMGNDIPFFSLGWLRGDMDLVSTELSVGYHPGSGSRGIMYPPVGRFAPVYKLAVEHAKSRFVNVWMYSAEKPEMSKVLYYEGLATHALPRAGVPQEPQAVTREFFQFVKDTRDTFGARVPLEDVGLYYSSSSQLSFMTPGGYFDMDRQPHMFAFWGWGTALTELHYQYRAIPEWKLDADTLSTLKVLIIPNATVLDPQDVEQVLEPWVKAGGALIVTGESGLRRGEAYNFSINQAGLSLATLTGVSSVEDAPVQKLAKYGDGVVLYLRDPVGLDYYVDERARSEKLGAFREAMETVSQGRQLLVDAKTVPTTVGLTLYVDEAAERLFIDLNNVDIDVATDTVKEASSFLFGVALPEWLKDKPLKATVLSPEERKPVASIAKTDDGTLRVLVSRIKYYASIMIEAR